jgi:hypothetical protein
VEQQAAIHGFEIRWSETWHLINWLLHCSYIPVKQNKIKSKIHVQIRIFTAWINFLDFVLFGLRKKDVELERMVKSAGRKDGVFAFGCLALDTKIKKKEKKRQRKGK